MRFAALLPVGLFVLVLSVLGVRLLLLARRTRELPEACLGAGLVLLSLVGMPLAAAGRIPATVGTPLGHALFALGMAAVMTALSLLFVFTWRVFRPTEAWARWGVSAACLVLLAVGVGISWSGSQAREITQILSNTRGWSLSVMGIVALNFAWSGGESIAYYRLYRRRLAIGMADPVLMNRFLLWGISALAAALLCGGLALCVQAGMVIMLDIRPLTLIAGAGSVMCASWILTFFPPIAYQRYLRRNQTPLE